MSLTIEVPPDVEQALERQARLHAVSVPEYVVSLLRLVASGSGQVNVGEIPEIATRMLAVERIGGYSSRTGLPPLPASAVGDVYREREDSQL